MVTKEMQRGRSNTVPSQTQKRQYRRSLAHPFLTFRAIRRKSPTIHPASYSSSPAFCPPAARARLPPLPDDPPRPPLRLPALGDLAATLPSVLVSVSGASPAEDVVAEAAEPAVSRECLREEATLSEAGTWKGRTRRDRRQGTTY